jgi:hypothetical protein
MRQTVHTDFESRLIQILSHCVGNTVFTLWHKVKARMESVLQLEVHYLLDA